jgi:Aromatic acid exporter family member 1
MKPVSETVKGDVVQSEVPSAPPGREIDLPSATAAGNDAAVATPWRSFGRRLRGRLSTAVLRIRRRWRSAAFRAARLAGAAVAAYLAAEALGLVNPPPLVAALTALLVVQATASSTLFRGVERVLAVILGVALALGFASVVGLTWWSLGILVAVSIVIGQLMRLGPNLIEVPISAMLVLGVGFTAGAEAAATSRAVETLIGAVVGVLVNVLFPPSVRSRYGGQAVQRLAEEIAALLEEAAEGIGPTPGTTPTRSVTDSGNFFPTGTGWFTIPSVDRTSGDLGLTTDATRRWLDDARRLNRHVPRVDRALTHAEESRRLNVRALGTPESTRSLRAGLEALEMGSVAVRTLFRAIDDWVRGGMVEPDSAYAARARIAWTELLNELAVAVRAFGVLLRAEVEGSARAEEAELDDALDRLRLGRLRHAEALLANPREHPDLWELDSALVTLVDRMLLELDGAAHARLWEEHRRDVVDRHRASELFDRLRTRRAERRTAEGQAHAGGVVPPQNGDPGEQRPSRDEEAP